MVRTDARALRQAADAVLPRHHLRPPRLGPVGPVLRRADARGADGRRARRDGRRRLGAGRDLRDARGRADGGAVRRHPPRPGQLRWSCTPPSPGPPGRRTTTGPGPPSTATGRWACSSSTGARDSWPRCVAPSMRDEPGFMEWAGRLERLAASPGTIRRIFELIGEFDVRGVLPSIRVPTLVMHRDRDTFIKVEHSRYMASKIPGARYVELEGEDNMFSLGDIGGCDRRDRGVPHRHPARSRARSDARHGAVHGHLRLHQPRRRDGRPRLALPARTPRRAVPAGARPPPRAGRSSAPATASSPPSTGPRGLSAARPPWPRRWARSGSRSGRGCTRESWR